MDMTLSELTHEYEISEKLKAPYPISSDAKKRRENWRSHIRSKYRLTEQAFMVLLENQECRCAICGTDDPFNRHNFYTPWCVDHCHTSGAIRGILCEGCNYAIGILGDSVEGLTRALNYLKDHYAGKIHEIPKPKEPQRTMIPTEKIDTSKMRGSLDKELLK